jgi:hypothetical protein
VLEENALELAGLATDAETIDQELRDLLDDD